MKTIFAIALLLACGVCPGATVAAPADAAMLAPGVYTTADISRRCQTYTSRRVGSTRADTERQSVFLACVQKLYGDEYGAAAGPALTEAPVGLPNYGPRLYRRYGCATDEGYGRLGSCDTF